MITTETPTCIILIKIVTHIFAAETFTRINVAETFNCIIATETVIIATETFITATKRSTNISLKNKSFMAPFFKDGVQLPQGWSHFEEAVYFLPLVPEIPGTHFIDLGRMKG